MKTILKYTPIESEVDQSTKLSLEILEIVRLTKVIAELQREKDDLVSFLFGISKQTDAMAKSYDS